MQSLRDDFPRGNPVPGWGWRAVAFGLILVPGWVGAQTLVTNPPPFLTTNVYNGPASQRLNIVVFGDGHTSNQTALFQTHVTNIVVNYLFTMEPYKSYATYFNVYSIFTASLESGADHPEPGVNTSRDTCFDSTYYTYNITRLLSFKQSGRIYPLLTQFCPDYNAIIGIVNDSTYGGSGGSIAVTSIHGSAPEIAIHELGHSVGGLADEYEDITPGYTPAERPNCTAQTNRLSIKWTAWINEATPIPTAENSGNSAVVGLFEGCMYTNANWFRPHYDSFMRSLGRPIGSVNSDQLVKKFYAMSPDHIEPFTGFAPASATLQVGAITDLTFTVASMSPVSNTMAIVWALDGTNLVGQIGTNLLLSSCYVGNGSHQVSTCVSDLTSFVRIYTNSSFPANPLAKSMVWTLSVSNQTPLWWLARYFPDTNDFTAAALSDIDHDGVPAWAEYIADTDPTNAAMRLEIAAFSNPPTATALFWSSSNRYYTLEWRTNLTAGTWSAVAAQSNKPGTGGWFSMAVSNAASGVFYRLSVRAP